MTQASQEPALSAEDTARLVDFARGCKAAARAVGLYPNGHPSIVSTLGRIMQMTAPGSLPAPMRISVLTGSLLLDGRPPARADTAVAELATLLHAHLIGEITIHPGGDVEAWRSFLLLIGRPPEAVRAEGGISRLWMTSAPQHVELREIDYAEVLRERKAGEHAAWEKVIANCLQGDVSSLDEETMQTLLTLAGDVAKLEELIAALEERAIESGRGLGARTTALLRLLQSLVEVVTRQDPGRVEPTLRNLATAVGRLSPDMMVSLLSHGGQGEQSAEVASLVGAVVSRMSDGTIAGFVARHALTNEPSLGQGESIDRVAQAFQTLVRDGEQQRLLTMAHDEAANSALGALPGFEQAWDEVAQKILTSYSDKPFVSDAYGRELSRARVRAVAVEQAGDDPPERVRTWLGTLAQSEVRTLDLTLLLDLLAIEEVSDRWGLLMRPVVSLIEDYFLVGDIDAAERLVGALVHHTGPHASPGRRQTALIAVDVLVAGPMMRHIVGHLATIDDGQFERVKAMCLSLGEVLIRPLAEALSIEERVRPRERLTAVLLAFGAIGRREVERLKSSANPAVRRTAIYLLREFGGTEALPDLTELLDDNEPRVQREAVRAILNIGTDKAYRVLQQALASGTAASREAIMQSLLMVRDERATPLFSYILEHVDHRGEMRSIYLGAIEALGALKDTGGVAALKNALYRGEWWAPRRTAGLRRAAAAALVRIGSAEAREVVAEAARAGSRGVRQAARVAQTAAPRTEPAR